MIRVFDFIIFMEEEITIPDVCEGSTQGMCLDDDFIFVSIR